MPSSPSPLPRKQVRFRTISLDEISSEQLSISPSWPGVAHDEDPELRTPDHTTYFCPNRMRRPHPHQVASPWDLRPVNALLLPWNVGVGANAGSLPPRPIVKSSSWPGVEHSKQDSEVRTPDHTTHFYSSRTTKRPSRQVVAQRDLCSNGAPLLPNPMCMDTNLSALSPRPVFLSPSMDFIRIPEINMFTTAQHSKALYYPTSQYMHDESKEDEKCSLDEIQDDCWIDIEEPNYDDSGTLKELLLLPANDNSQEDHSHLPPIPPRDSMRLYSSTSNSFR